MAVVRQHVKNWRGFQCERKHDFFVGNEIRLNARPKIYVARVIFDERKQGLKIESFEFGEFHFEKFKI